MPPQPSAPSVTGRVVFVPGLGLDAREWAGVWPLLAGPSTVVSVPSMGRPARRRADLSVPALANELRDTLAEGDGVVLVGHSASCQVVAQAAADDDRVAGVVLVGPTTDPAAKGWLRLVARWVRTAPHERTWEVRALAPQYRRTGLRSIAAGMHRVRHHRVDDALASTSVPVVVVRGEHDRIAPQQWCRHLAEVSGGEVRTVAGGAHMLPLTHPDAVAEAVASVRARV